MPNNLINIEVHEGLLKGRTVYAVEDVDITIDADGRLVLTAAKIYTADAAGKPAGILVMNGRQDSELSMGVFSFEDARGTDAFRHLCTRCNERLSEKQAAESIFCEPCKIAQQAEVIAALRGTRSNSIEAR